MNPAWRSFSTYALMAAAFFGCTCRSRCLTGLTSGYILISCSTILESMPGISSYDQAKTSLNSRKRALYISSSEGEQPLPT